MDYKDAANLTTKLATSLYLKIIFFIEKSLIVSFLPSKYQLSF